jgi:hypothetical protein
MATVNKRTRQVQNVVINGVDNGGAMSASIQAGYDVVLNSAPDGLQVPIKDRMCQFIRGTIKTQDWTLMADLLAGTLGTLVFYERKSGVDAATGFIEHTITSPVIHSVKISQRQDGHAEITFSFEVRFTSETATIATMWAIADSHAGPTYIAAARGGYRVVSALHGAVNIYHVTAFDFGLSFPIFKACNDSDLGYTAVDGDLEGGMAASGSISAQDMTVTSSKTKLVDLLLAARGSLVLTLQQSGGAANKIVTIAGVIFTGGPMDGSGSATEATGFNLAFEVCNSAALPLTLAGSNKIITIADAA